MGRGGKWPKDSAPAQRHTQGGNDYWGYWRGAKSPTQQPWRRPNAPESTSFPAFDAEYVELQEDHPRRTVIELDDNSDGGPQLMRGLQSVLNSARKAEVRTMKACAARTQTKAQWEKFLEKFKASYVKEKRRFEQILARQEKEVEEAKQAQSAARAIIRQAALNVEGATHKAPPPAVDEQAEWDAMRREWEKDQGQEYGDVFRRAMEEGVDTVTPMRGRQAAPRSPTSRMTRLPEAQIPPGAFKYMTTPDAERAKQKMSPSPTTDGIRPDDGGTDGAGNQAPLPADSAASAEDNQEYEPAKREGRTPIPRTAPLKTVTKTPPRQPDHGSTSLSDKLEAKRSALKPFHGARAAGEPTPEAAKAGVLDDDPDEPMEELDKAAPSPGLGKME